MRLAHAPFEEEITTDRCGAILSHSNGARRDVLKAVNHTPSSVGISLSACGPRNAILLSS